MSSGYGRIFGYWHITPAVSFGYVSQGELLGYIRPGFGHVHFAEKRVTITAANQHSKTDYNLYEGTEVTGSPEVVLLRGQVLVEGDELVASPGVGQFVPRARFGEELRPARAQVPA